MGDEGHKASKHKHQHDKHAHEHAHKSKKRRRDDEGGERKHKKDKSKKGQARVVDDDPDEDMWVEQNVDIYGEQSVAANIPASGDMNLTSNASSSSREGALSTRAVASETSLKRDDWMLAPQTAQVVPVGEDMSESPDFFSGLGREHRKKPPPRIIEQPKVSTHELNPELRESAGLSAMPAASTSAPAERKTTPGGPGSQWRMMKLRRVYETAEDEGKSVEEIAIDRFETLEAFEEAKQERQILDEREGRRGGSSSSRRDNDFTGEKRFVFTDVGGSGASRSTSFRRPDMGGSTPKSPIPTSRPAVNPRFDSLRLPSQGNTTVHTPIPTVMNVSQANSSSTRPLSPSSLNKLQAKVLRAKLIGTSNADKLQEEYDRELQRASGGEQGGVEVKVLPTLDSRGRMYDVGQGREEEEALPGNRRKKEPKVETRDPKTGEIVRYNADDDTTSLGEMLRQERFGAGMADQKNLDAQYAKAILSDGKFQNDLDYIDDNAEKLGRQKMRSDDYKKTQKALAECSFCFGEDDSPPNAPMIAMGTRVYLSCTTQEELVPGHSLIVPIQHHLTMLEGDDDVWDEVRNFMKSLMRMFAEDDKGVIFYETVISLKAQKHTVIECVPLPWEHFDDIPAYFKESILMSEAEWSQHKKLIDFAARPGGFRRAMVPNLPYFMVQFDYKGEKGYGHVIEGSDKAGDDEEAAMNDGDKGGGDFPRYVLVHIR
ncbi:hypothetical protein EUX98_g3001 [Antrodiella citrinella]|uniref:Cwf19-like C-terminal domain-containing protein n=1 Tax=Antrodiella citrinella TaxID=2447956 RepID=A0A4S4MXL0_9APHY|nr:hypothetical protein EUX98_g3001 [Antrodiella citrinella]